MASYSQLSLGSKGNDTTELQKLLNQSGYSLEVDGDFGPKTQAAVRDYQEKNNLTVDGIAGNQTWNSLKGKKPEDTATTPGFRPAEGAGAAQTAGSGSPAPDDGIYTESDTVSQAKQLLEQHMAGKPGQYQYPWQSQLDEYLNQILNREEFQYDLNGDALYQQYKDQYMTQGKMAMMDTMGQAQAMTGGYGNSYAQSVGQQTYQGHLRQLNDKVPELYQLALQKYQMEDDALARKYGILAEDESRAYGRHLDAENDWLAERDYLAGRYDSERDYDYGKYQDERNFAYGRHRDEIADRQWQTEFDEARRQYDQQFQYQTEQDAKDETWRQREWDYQTEQDAKDETWRQKEWDYQTEQDALALLAGNEREFQRAVFSGRTDDYDNYIFYIDGKEYTYAKGVNPYTGTTNGDVKNGTFSNGYQPDNIGGEKLSKSGITDVVNGITQNVWQTPDGKLWIWDGTQNKYLRYGDDSDGEAPREEKPTANEKRAANRNKPHSYSQVRI